MTFADQRKTDFYNIMLGEFAETVTYQPVNGAHRLVVVRIREGQVSQQTVREDAALAQLHNRVLVTVGRDESHAKGGVAAPVRSATDADTFQRANDSDVYVYTGEVAAATPHSWTLWFERRRAIGSTLDHRRM